MKRVYLFLLLCVPSGFSQELPPWDPELELAYDEAETPGTLFRWNYGEGSGGPDLDEPIVTDRPDFTEASVTVGKGVTQLEMGYTFTANDDGGEKLRENSFGEPLLRTGILVDWLEFRVAVFPTEQRVESAGVSASTAGLSDLYLGVKFALTGQEGILPEMALVPQINVPTGSPAFTTDQLEPGVNWLYSWDINETLSTGGSTQFNRAAEESGESYLEIAQSWTIGYGLTDELSAYTEWFAFFPHGAEESRVQHYFDGGFTYLISSDVQFDIRAGVGLNDSADDYFVGTGLSIRFP